MSNIKLKFICLFLVLTTIPLAGCALITGQTTDEGIPPDTELGRMLGLLPYSFPEEHDIWFGSLGKATEMHGRGDLNSYMEIIEVIEQVPEERQGLFMSDLGATLIAHPIFWSFPDVASLTGLDVLAADRILCGNKLHPHGYYIFAGDYDEALIGQKLTELGYTKTYYGRYSYYGIRGDFETDLRHPLGFLLADMNRVAVLDNTVITSPVTADITGIFDTMTGNTPSAIENEACRALVASLGDGLMATLTTPERIIYCDMSGEEEPLIESNFTVPADWGVLRGYRMAALGCRAEGDRRYLDIALYYDDEASATTDGKEIIKRMSGYTLDTWLQGAEGTAFTDRYQPGEPTITRYAGGVVLKITCRILLSPEEQYGVSTVTAAGVWPLRDLLFLAPDPSLYAAKE
jgi:hypothetical protein